MPRERLAELRRCLEADLIVICRSVGQAGRVVAYDGPVVMDDRSWPLPPAGSDLSPRLERDPAVLRSLLSTSALLALPAPVTACATIPGDEGWTVVAWHKEPPSDADDRLRRFAPQASALADVTVLRRRAETAEISVDHILASASVGIVIADPDGRSRANPVAARLLGLPGRALPDPSALGPALQALVRRATNGQEILPALAAALLNPDNAVDDWLLRFESEPTHLRVSSRPLPVSTGGGRVWTFRDESGAHRLREEERALAGSRRRFEDIIARSAIGTALLSPEGRFLEVNPALARFLGRTQAELLGCTCADVSHPDDLASAAEEQQAIRDGKADFLETTHRFLGPGGSVVYGHLMLRAIRRPDGTLEHQIAQILDVDQSVRTEQRADQERARFQASIEAMLDPHVVLGPIRDAQGDIVDYVYRETNQAACAYNDMTRERLVGARLLELFPGVKETEIWTTCLRASTLGIPGVLDDFWLHNDLQGRARYYDIRIIPVGDELSYTWRDVTERHEVVQGVVDSEALLRAILDSMPDMFALFAPVRDETGATIDFEYVDVNQACCDTTGLTRDEHRGVLASAVWPHFTSSRLFELEKQTMDSGEPLALDAYRYEDACGPGRDAYFTIRAARVEGLLATLLRDVTTQQNAANAIAESEQRYRLLAENTSDIVAVLNNGVFDWVSPSITRTLGWAPHDLVGRRLDDFFHPDDVTARIRTAQTTDELAQGLRLRIRSRDVAGDYHWLDVSAGLLRDDLGAPVGVLASGRVIDDRVQAEQDLVAAREAAEASAAAKSTFLTNMSHEIRTPLSAVLGLLQLLEGTALSPEQADYTARARHSANFLLAVLNSVLDYSKIEAGAMTLHEEPVSLGELVNEVGDIVRNSVGGKPVDVHTMLDPGMPNCVLVDGLRLRQVLLNLASNAVKFTAAGAVTLAVDVIESTGERCRLRVSVADTGIGIDPDALDRIFDGFTQAETSTARRFGGTGLGLTISRSLVQLMGSDLEVTSTVGAGSTFAFTLDLVHCKQAPMPRPGTPKESEPPHRRLEGLRILLADDNQVNNTIASELLKREGALVWPALDGVSAVELALGADQDFDAILMDVQMPRVDGLEATRRIRAVPRLAHVPILAVTAHSSLVEQARCLEAGMDAYLTKPFEIGELSEMVLLLSGKGASAGSPAPSQSDPDSAVDGVAALELLGGDRVLYARVLRTFLDQLPGLTAALVSALRSQDRSVVVQVAHGLKGSSGTLGAQRLYAVSAEIENAFRSTAPLSDIDDVVTRLEDAAAATARDARRWL